MSHPYIISEFALLRRNEIVDIPEEFMIHEDYLGCMSQEELTRAFEDVKNLFNVLLTDIALAPANFGLPTCTTEQYRLGPEYNQARVACDWPFYLLLYLFSNGQMRDGKFIVDVAAFKQANKGKRSVGHIDVLFKSLAQYGFVFDTLKDGMIPRNASSFEIAFLDKPSVLTVLNMVADKCYHLGGENGFVRFRTWNYRVLTQPKDTFSFGSGAEHVADSLHTISEKAFVFAFHDTMMTRGLICEVGAWHEGPFIRYYENKTSNAYLFEVMLNRDQVTLRLRIRNAQACMEYLTQCPKSIQDMFRRSNQGCEKRQDGTCHSSTQYVYEGEQKWRCGCWGAAFFAPMLIENIPHYIELVELGKKKAVKHA